MVYLTFLRLLIWVQTLCVGVICASSSASILHEELHVVPPGWRHIGCPPDDQVLELHISLAQQNEKLLQSLVHQVSDPDSLCYGHYLDREEVDELFSPTLASREQVRDWLLGAGVSERDLQMSTHGIGVSLSVERANKILNSSFQNYHGPGGVKARAMRYHIPASLKAHIDHVSPTVYFGSWLSGEEREEGAPSSTDIATTTTTTTKRRRRTETAAAVPEDCQRFWTPACLRQAYNIGTFQVSGNTRSRVGWGAFWNASARYSDLKEYEHMFELPPGNFTIELVNAGASADQAASPNGRRRHLNDLDAFTIAGVAGGRLPMVQYSVGGRAPRQKPDAAEPDPKSNAVEPWLALYEHLLGKPNAELPQVLTHSYSEDEQTVPRRYAERVCRSVGMLALRGITVIQTMAGAGPGTACMSNDGHRTPQLNPQFPASCPYVTGVGEVNQTNPLTTWNITSGGFSRYWHRPAWQHDAVQAYLRDAISNETLQYYAPLINQHGRASPDLSLAGYKPDDQGDFYSKPSTPSGGTRGNAAWAALVGLLNDARLREGRPAMGFLNPWLYRRVAPTANLGRGLVDVTRGASIGCVGRNIQFDRVLPEALVIPGIAWNATAGWDPATGLGFPDFQALLRSAMEDGPAAAGEGEGKGTCVLVDLQGKPITTTMGRRRARGGGDR